jgi:hypothetical protein
MNSSVINWLATLALAIVLVALPILHRVSGYARAGQPERWPDPLVAGVPVRALLVTFALAAVASRLSADGIVWSRLHVHARFNLAAAVIGTAVLALMF